MSKRQLCEHCDYPSATCFCEAVAPCDNLRNVILLQSKAESKHAKNTGRLLQLSLNKIEILNSDDAIAMQGLKRELEAAPNGYCLFFPSSSSVAFETSLDSQRELSPTFIFIDLTWRKAKRLLLENEWLNKVAHYHFSENIESHYRIRKTSIDNGLSTLESVAYALEKADNTDIAPLIKLFEKMQSFWPHQS